MLEPNRNIKKWWSVADFPGPYKPGLKVKVLWPENALDGKGGGVWGRRKRSCLK